MSLYYRSLIQTASLLLDLYPNAAVAYSLRKLRTAYSGNSVRVRRAVDNTEQDFGFDINGDLDIAGIESFFGNNLLLQSENFNTSWTKANTVVTTGSGSSLRANGWEEFEQSPSRATLVVLPEDQSNRYEIFYLGSNTIAYIQNYFAAPTLYEYLPKMYGTSASLSSISTR